MYDQLLCSNPPAHTPVRSTDHQGEAGSPITVWPCGNPHARLCKRLFSCGQRDNVLPRSLMRQILAAYTQPGDLIVLPLPGYEGPDLWEGIDALGEALRLGRRAIGVTTQSCVETVAAFRHGRGSAAPVYASEPTRITDALPSQSPDLVLAVRPFLPDSDQWPDLVAQFYAWRTSLRPGGTLITITPAPTSDGHGSRTDVKAIDELVIPVATTAGFTLTGRHITVHRALPIGPAGRTLPAPRLVAHTLVRAFRAPQAVTHG
jgi:hypothetical protein